ncbi:MAG: methylated-DNA--[protein]-cysteine S-methyltransferase [Clostridiales bacterium]|jgi:methylated-DNA-[protein]-cysteine S-methyltransferase|nr:methylated-DNA--[protein]-cysteine S-methyltransferase [Clostridiales bacterium]
MREDVLYYSPAGILRIVCDGDAITTVEFDNGDTDPDEAEAAGRFEYGSASPVIRQCVEELDAYFEGTLRKFTVKIMPCGTDFWRLTWDELTRIPYGTTISYRQLAARIGSPKAVRAVGGANHNNPIVILIPCHRVIGSDGTLVGYAGGLEKKKFLLDHEELHSEREWED